MGYFIVSVALLFTRDQEKLRKASLWNALAAAAVTVSYLVLYGGVSNDFHPFG